MITTVISIRHNSVHNNIKHYVAFLLIHTTTSIYSVNFSFSTVGLHGMREMISDGKLRFYVHYWYDLTHVNCEVYVKTVMSRFCLYGAIIDYVQGTVRSVFAEIVYEQNLIT